MSVGSPIWSAAAAAAVLLAAGLAWWFVPFRGERHRGAVVLALRCAVIAALLVFVAGPYRYEAVPLSSGVVFAVDVSEGVPPVARKAALESVFQIAPQLAATGRSIEIVLFAGRAAVVASFSSKAAGEENGWRVVAGIPVEGSVAVSPAFSQKGRAGNGDVNTCCSLQEARGVVYALAGVFTRGEIDMAALSDRDGLVHQPSESEANQWRSVALAPMETNLADALHLATEVAAAFDEAKIVVFTDGRTARMYPDSRVVDRAWTTRYVPASLETGAGRFSPLEKGANGFSPFEKGGGSGGFPGDDTSCRQDAPPFASSERIASKSDAYPPGDAMRAASDPTDAPDLSELPEELQNALRRPARKGIELFLVPLTVESYKDAVALALLLPSDIRAEEPFECRVRFKTNFAGRARVTLFHDSEVIAEREGDILLPSEYEWSMGPVRATPGFHTFSATVAMAGDMDERNNVVLAGALVGGKVRVLLLEGTPDAGVNVARMLEVEGLDVTKIVQESLPRNVLEIADFDVCFLVQPDFNAFSEEQKCALVDYVREVGGGVLTITGVSAKTCERLADKRLADLLPVRFDLQLNKTASTPGLEQPARPPETPREPPAKPPDAATEPTEVARVALLLALDTSGSMSGKKIGLLRESAIATLETLAPDDVAGVIAFDSRPRWILRPVEVRAAGGVVEQVARLRAGGGTHIYPALLDAYKALVKVDAQVKHVIVLTDGFTRLADFQTLVEAMTRDGITVSTIGIGDEINSPLLANMAQWGKGRFYYTNTFDEIPQVFTWETTRVRSALPGAGRAAVENRPEETAQKPPAEAVEQPGSGPDLPPADVAPSEGTSVSREFAVSVGENSSLLRGISPAEIPSVGGLLKGEARPGALVLLQGRAIASVDSRQTARTAEDRAWPLLALAHVGAGQTAVWTSDYLTREGAGKWLEWRLLPKLLAQVARGLSLQHNRHLETMEIRTYPATGGVNVEVSVADIPRPGCGVSAGTLRDAPTSAPQMAPERIPVSLPDSASEQTSRVIVDDERLKALVAGPWGRIKTFEFERVAAGKFRTFIPLTTTAGVAMAVLKYSRGDGVDITSTVGLALPYEPEIAAHGVDDSFFSALSPEAVHICSLESVPNYVLDWQDGFERRKVPTGQFLLAAVPFLLLLEVVVRRVRMRSEL